MNVIKIVNFAIYLYKENIFRDGNPKLVLLVIKKYLEIEKNNFRKTIVYSRSTDESVKLVSALIDTYLEEESPVVLSQALKVLEYEFIRRGK